MAKLLIAHGKYGNVIFDITAPEQEEKAWLALVGYHAIQGFYYNVHEHADQATAYAGAKRGRWTDAKWLCQLRDDYEYETWEIEHTASQDQITNWIGGIPHGE